MAPHLTLAELDFVHGQEKNGKTTIEIHTLLTRKRDRQGISTPCLPRFRRALRGLTYKRARKETRGRKAKLNRRLVLKMNSKRKLLIKQAKGQREIRWDDVRKSIRAPKMHRATVLRSFRREGLPVDRLSDGWTNRQTRYATRLRGQQKGRDGGRAGRRQGRRWATRRQRGLAGGHRSVRQCRRNGRRARLWRFPKGL